MGHEECPMAVTVRTGRPVRGAEAIAERPDGSRYTFLPHPTPLFDDDGRLVGAVNMLVDITDRKQAEEASHRLAAIVASSDDAIISKTLDGVITSWNEGAERLFGYSDDEIVGHSILTLIPPDRQDEERIIIERLRRGERVEHFETIRQHKSGRPIDISLTVSPVRRDDGTIIGASKIARDITDRKRAEETLLRHAERLETLNRVSTIISRDLDLGRIVQEVTDIATGLIGARFGAFFYNVLDEKGESYLLYTLSGAPREAFERFGMPRNTDVFRPTFEGTAVVRSDDIRQDPRYGRNAPRHGMPEGHLPVVSYLAVPVRSSSGDVLGGLFFGHDLAAVFDSGSETLVSAIAGQAAVAIDNARLHGAAQTEIEQRRRAEDAKELLLNEIKHRIKNTLATVQAIAMQTFRGAPPEERDAFVARIQALSGAQDVLTRHDWTGAGIVDVVELALRPFRADDRTRITDHGPDDRLDPAKALLLAMALHELGTNAAKYGALSNDHGLVDVGWIISEIAERRHLVLTWQERGGPVVTPPTRKGFGSRMIESALRGEQGSVTFDFEAAGLTATLRVAL
jgi:PAS domain S-box-containing protein